MKYENFYLRNNNYLITRTRKIYTRKEGQRGWPRNPEKSEDLGLISIDEYNKFVTSIPFFNSFGSRATCRATWCHTVAGYIPSYVTTVSPDGLTKHVDHFHFEFFSPYYARREAGFRELDCMDHAKRVEFAQDGDHDLYTFYHEDGEHAATYDATFRKWVG